jgi:hypothetical protein
VHDGLIKGKNGEGTVNKRGEQVGMSVVRNNTITLKSGLTEVTITVLEPLSKLRVS